jgi:CheY-like chemotaxis protein
MSKKIILLVDDDPILSEVVKNRIEEAGYICLWERDGKEGLARLYATPPHLLVLDIMMPSMNGYEVLEHINADPVLAATPVMVISNSGEPVEIQKILRLGVKDFIVKAHFSPEEVIEKIKKIIGESDSGSEVAGGRKPREKTTILIVEDDMTLSEIATDRLRHEGYQVYTVFDGNDGLKVAMEMRPDIILLDILMPGMNGFEVLEKLKADPALRGIAVIIFSNLAQEKDIAKGRLLGAADYIVKSNFTPSLIVEHIEQVLSKQ